MAKKKNKQKFTAGPKKIKGSATAPGKKASFGHGFGGMFGSVTPKKPEYDKPAPTRAVQSAQRRERMKRLSGKLI